MELKRLRKENATLKLREKTLLRLVKDLRATVTKNNNKRENCQDKELTTAEADAFRWALEKLDQKRSDVVELSSDIVANMTGQYHELLLQSSEKLQTRLETLTLRYWNNSSSQINRVQRETVCNNSKMSSNIKDTTSNFQDHLKTENTDLSEENADALQSNYNHSQTSSPNFKCRFHPSAGDAYKTKVHQTLQRQTLDVVCLDKFSAHEKSIIAGNIAPPTELMHAIIQSNDFHQFIVKNVTEIMGTKTYYEAPNDNYEVTGEYEIMVRGGILTKNARTLALQQRLIDFVSSCDILQTQSETVKTISGRYLLSLFRRAQRRLFQHHNTALLQQLAIQRDNEEGERDNDDDDKIVTGGKVKTWIKQITDMLREEVSHIMNSNSASNSQTAKHIRNICEQNITTGLASDLIWSIRTKSLQKRLRQTELVVQELRHRVHEAESLALFLAHKHRSSPSSAPLPPSTSRHNDSEPALMSGSSVTEATWLWHHLQQEVDAVFDRAANNLKINISSRKNPRSPLSSSPLPPKHEQQNHASTPAENKSKETKLDVVHAKQSTYRDDSKVLQKAMAIVYGNFNPKLVKRIPAILHLHEGRHEALQDRLMTKYGLAFKEALVLSAAAIAE